MRFLIFLALALLVVWLWRSSRRPKRPADPPATPPAAPPGPQDMVRCAHCGLHLPHNEAVVGRIGLYCSDAHRQTAEP